jgi:hypothetical protein
VQKLAFYKFGIKVVSGEINEGTYIVAWWETNKKSTHLNQRLYDMQVLEQGKFLNLVKRYEVFDLIVGKTPYNILSRNNMWI